jgi:hypothetical protein
VLRNQLLALATGIGLASSAHSQTLDQQATCAAQAERAFQEYSAEDKAESAKLGMPSEGYDYQSHYNKKINRCLILTQKSYTSGGQPGTFINLSDALERRNYASWLWKAHPTKKYWEQPPISCE